ncbi:hypothetical protein, partial [Oceanispirochaeta sp.]|uniref:hypothetical protein n=1 Tax=Oceanispirochaeta sp. TaxID=2035350 RepID=UPI00261420A6
KEQLASDLLIQQNHFSSERFRLITRTLREYNVYTHFLSTQYFKKNNADHCITHTPFTVKDLGAFLFSTIFVYKIKNPSIETLTVRPYLDIIFSWLKLIIQYIRNV